MSYIPGNLFSGIAALFVTPIALIFCIIMLILGNEWWSLLPMTIPFVLYWAIRFLEKRS